MPDSEQFMFEPSVLPLPEATRAVLVDQWADLGRAGTWWTGEERTAIATVARAARGDRPTATVPIAPTAATVPIEPIKNAAIDGTASRAAALVAGNAGAIGRETVEELVADGLDPLAYVELVGIVARVTAIDTAVTGLGSDLPPFPPPESGEPSRTEVAGTKQRSAWVPMAGAAGATTALSAVAAEDRAQEKLHGALYLSYQEMGDLGIVKALSRAQMELIAARTSYHNDCYF